jgi:PAS domain S-box-containing protein
MLKLTAEDDLKNIVLTAPIGICILNADTLVAEIVNDKFLEVAGKPYEAIAGQFYWDAFAEARAYYEDALSNVVRDGKPYYANEVELMLIRHGKEEMVFVTFVYAPVLNQEDQVTKVAVWVLENTMQVVARQNIELTNIALQKTQDDLHGLFQQLEASEIALRLAVQAANFGTWFIHSVTREFITDKRLKELFGYYPDEALSIEQAIAQITDEYREYVSTTLENAISGNGDYDVTYAVIGLHDQKLRWLRAIGNLKAHPSGEFSAFTGVVMDVTEQQKDDQRKNDFIGMVSHELKTPLTSLKAIIQLAGSKLDANDDPFLSTAMNRANLQLNRMSAMINDFLNISRLESGKLLITKKTFDIKSLVLDVIEEEKLIVKTHHLLFHPCDTIMVHADASRVGTVVSNLIGNAVKYSASGTDILVACEKQSDHVSISVTDHGIGINEADQQRIFDRYYRAEADKMEHISGFGIGLYLSAEIIKRHDGELTVTSEKGKGSTFSFTLPLPKNNV